MVGVGAFALHGPSPVPSPEPPPAPASPSPPPPLPSSPLPSPCAQNVAEAAPLLATPAAAKANAPQLQHLAVWAPLPLLDAMALAAGKAGRHPAVLAYVMRSLEACPPEDVAFFLPQLVQASAPQAGRRGGGPGWRGRAGCRGLGRSVPWRQRAALLQQGRPERRVSCPIHQNTHTRTHTHTHTHTPHTPPPPPLPAAAAL